MATVITINGIDEAVTNLNYRNEKALKYRLLSLIREHYEEDVPIGSVTNIETDHLIRVLWDTGDDPDAIVKKRKNFSTVKSTVNADLKRLYKDGENSEGVKIGPDNVFVMSEEAREKVLEKLRSSMNADETATLGEILDILKVLNETLLKPEVAEWLDGKDGSNKMDQLKNLIRGMSDVVGLEDQGAAEGTIRVKPVGEVTVDVDADEGSGIEGVGEGGEEDDPLDLIDIEDDAEEIESDEEVEEIDEEELLEEEEAEEDLEEIDGLEELEEDEIEDEEVEDIVEEADEEEDLLDEDDLEEVEDEEIEEIPDEIEEVEEEEPEEILELAEEDEDIEEIEAEEDLEDLDALEELSDEELEELAEEGEEDVEALEEDEDIEEIEADDVVELAEVDEVDEVDEDEIEEVSEEGEGDLEDLDALEEVSDEELEELAEEGEEDVEALEEDEDIEEIEADDVVELAEVDEVDEVDDDEIEEVPEELEEEADDLDDEVEEIDPEDLEEVDAIEEVDDDLEEAEVDVEDVELAVDEEEDPAGVVGGSSFDEYETDDKTRNARILAEEFDSYLGAMDRYFNQYLMIPEADFTVGSADPQKEEKSLDLVHLPAFYIGKFPITNALFEIFVEKTGYKTKAEEQGYSTVYSGRYQQTTNAKTGQEILEWNSALVSKVVEGACWYQPTGPGSTLRGKRNHPVVHVSVEDAMAFAAWTGKRLPTENEWEAASRTSDAHKYPWGNEQDKERCNIEESYIGDTSPVDRHIDYQNEYGITDAIGNVMEWTIDSEMEFGEEGQPNISIAKGASWVSDEDKNLLTRLELETDTRSNILGFRCVAF